MSDKVKKPETEHELKATYKSIERHEKEGDEDYVCSPEECSLCLLHKNVCAVCVMGPERWGCMEKAAAACVVAGVAEPNYKDGYTNKIGMVAVLQGARQKLIKRIEKQEKKATAAKKAEATSKAKKEKERIVWDRKKTYIRWESSGTYWVLSQRPDGLWGFVSDSGTWSCVSERDPQGCIDDTNWPISVHPTHTAALQYILDQEASKREPKPWKEYRHGDKVGYDREKIYIHYSPKYFGSPQIVPRYSSEGIWYPLCGAIFNARNDSAEGISHVLAEGMYIGSTIYECNTEEDACKCMLMIVREKARAGN